MNAPFRPRRRPAGPPRAPAAEKAEPTWKFHVAMASAIVGAFGFVFLVVASLFFAAKHLGPEGAMALVGAVLVSAAGATFAWLRNRS